MHVYPGDKVDLEVWEYHEGSSGFGTTSTPASTLVNMLAGAFATGVPAVDAQITSGVNSGVGAWGPGGGNRGDARPAAYLNYILFDKHYNVLNMGWQLAPDATFTKQKISFSTMNIKEEGYLFAYLSYDDDSNNWVYFDDLKVTHTKTNVIQYNEYYPFGLQAATSWTRDDSKNNFLYNEGGELNTATGVYDLFYRNYDPVLGRLNQVDPKSGAYAGLSPYNYAGNNPVLNNDPFGDDWYDDMNAARWRGQPYMGPYDDGHGGGNDSNSSGWGSFGYGDGAMEAYSSYGMSPGAAARFASLGNYGAHWSFGGHADYSGAIAAGNMILGEEAAQRKLRHSLAAASDFEFGIRLGANGFHISYQYGISGVEDGLFFAGVASATAFIPLAQNGSVFNAEDYIDGMLKMNIGDKVTGKEISELLKSLNADLPLDVADVIKNVTRVEGGLQVNLTLLARGALKIVPKTPNVKNGAIVTITREAWTDNKNSVLHLVSPDIEIYYDKKLFPLNIYLNNNGFTMDRKPYPSYYPILKGKW